MEEPNGYNSGIELPPGFRFHPTDEELVTYYLSPKVLDSNFTTKAIGEVDLNKVEPWDLPWKAKFGEREWYFFCLRDRKYPSGSRTNRATVAGYWKATGKDKEIFRAKVVVGMKKTLVFYRGRAPKGTKTNWVMHEYRLQGKNPNIFPKTAKGEWVICRAFKKSSGGNRVHVSGLVKSVDPCLDLPPLTDLSSGGGSTRRAQGSHVTCFSNLKHPHQPESLQEYTSPSSSNSDFLYPNSLLLKQEQTALCHLLKANSPCIKQNAAAELSLKFLDLYRSFTISRTNCKTKLRINSNQKTQEIGNPVRCNHTYVWRDFSQGNTPILRASEIQE